jgi:hypothetical protein
VVWQLLVCDWMYSFQLRPAVSRLSLMPAFVAAHAGLVMQLAPGLLLALRPYAFPNAMAS